MTQNPHQNRKDNTEIDQGSRYEPATKHRASTSPLLTEPTHRSSNVRTIPEAAGYLRISVSKMRRLLWSGEIRSLKIGRAIRVLQRDLDKFIERAASSER